jgi:hypothetical protein
VREQPKGKKKKKYMIDLEIAEETRPLGTKAAKVKSSHA